MGKERLELSWIAPRDPKSRSSASFDTSPCCPRPNSKEIQLEVKYCGRGSTYLRLGSAETGLRQRRRLISAPPPGAQTMRGSAASLAQSRRVGPDCARLAQVWAQNLPRSNPLRSMATPAAMRNTAQLTSQPMTPANPTASMMKANRRKRKKEYESMNLDGV